MRARSRRGWRVRGDEAVAVAMHHESASHEIVARNGMLGEGEAVTAGLDEAAAGDEGLEALGELPTLRTAEVELANQLFESGRAVRLPLELAKDDLVAKHCRCRTV